jgi:hypothetical protein
MSPPASAELEGLVRSAWQAVASESPSLVGVYAGTGSRIERAICFRLGIALHVATQTRLSVWESPWDRLVVDSELHRAYDGAKLNISEAPDLLVHVRGNDSANLLAVEVKFDQALTAADLDKLERLRSNRCYRHAWGVCVTREGRLEIVQRSGTQDG